LAVSARDQGDLAAERQPCVLRLKAKPKEPAIWQALHGVLDGGPSESWNEQAVRAHYD
jgi:hypothetical protein